MPSLDRDRIPAKGPTLLETLLGNFATHQQATREKLWGAAPRTPPVDPESLMSTEPEKNFSEAPPMSVAPPAMTAPLAAGSPQPTTQQPLAKKSSTARAEAAKPPQAKVEAAPVAAAPVQDAIAQMLAGNQSKAEGDRDSAKAKALAAKDLGDGEKIFTALMAVLPGLVGAIGGGAIAGGAGAAAGAAGGLSGGANAVGMMMGEKEQMRQEALGEAAAAQQRADKVGDQQLGHAEKLQGQEFQVGERKAGEQFATARQEDQQRFSERENIQRMRHDWQMQERRLDHELGTRLLAAQAKGPGGIKEYEGKLGMAAVEMADADSNMAALTNSLDKGLMGTLATSSWANILKSPELQQFAVEAARFLSPALHGETGTAISEKEWEDAKQRFIPLATDDDATRERKANARRFSTLKFYNFAGPEAQSVIQGQLKATAAPTQPAANQSHPLDAEAVRWAQNEGKGSPYAAQILRANGIQ